MNTQSTNPRTIAAQLDRQIAQAQRRKEQIIQAALKDKERAKESLEKEIEQLKSGQALAERPYARVLPRGVLTLAMIDTLRGNKKGLSAQEVAESLRKQEPFKNIPDLESRVRNSLNANRNHFKATSRGQYKAIGPVKGALFARLRSEQREAVPA